MLSPLRHTCIPSMQVFIMILKVLIHRSKCVHGHRGQTSEHAREIARGSHRSIRKTLHVAVKTAASSCESEAKISFYFNEVHRR